MHLVGLLLEYLLEAAEQCHVDLDGQAPSGVGDVVAPEVALHRLMHVHHDARGEPVAGQLRPVL
ncbi:hypothetical protein [Salana multivorans]